MKRARIVSTRDRQRIRAALDTSEDSVELTIGGHAFGVTHLSREYWPADAATRAPAVTKRDLLRYLVDVAPLLLPHSVDRPLTLFRWPTGINGRRVRQKHWQVPVPPFVARTSIFSNSKGHADDYILCNNLATLLWLGHMGALEMHAWHSRVTPGTGDGPSSTDFARSEAALQASVIEYPDYILFDIDPFIYSGSEPAGRHPEFNATAFDRAREVALWLHALLERTGLAAFVKTSGKTGLHVVVPILRTLRYDAAREVARLIGEHLLREHPDVVTTEWSVGKRSGKVFIDYNMNVRGKSMPLPYSLRGLPGAPVSMPLDWRDVRRGYPLDYRIDTVPARLAKRGDAWAGVPGVRQDLSAIFARSRGASALSPRTR
jgi:bifunctional non-homologous end joining protein LigD